MSSWRPGGNGGAERFIWILEENLLWVRTFDSGEDLWLVFLDVRETRTTTWIIERRGDKKPVQVRAQQLQAAGKSASP